MIDVEDRLNGAWSESARDEIPVQIERIACELAAECAALQLRVDHFEQVAANSPDPESALTWEAMQLVAA